MSCFVGSPATPTIRAEGITEKVGDIVLTCSGGSALSSGSAIPQLDFTVFLNTAATSRVVGSSAQGNFSEALLLVDEPGSATLTGYGASLPQNVCSTPLTGCAAYVGNIGPNSGVPVTAPGGTTAAPNAFMGIVSSNTVTFHGVPVQAGSQRIFRITNLRVNASVFPGPATISAAMTFGPANVITLNGPIPVLAMVQSGLSSSLRNAANTGAGSALSLNQCSAAFGGGVAGSILRYGEAFATAFKTRTDPVNGNTSTSSAFTGQNIPGQIYNSESGFTLAGAVNGSLVAGVADFGTRLKAVFSNVPDGVNIYVSTVNVASVSTAAPNASGNPTAVLLSGETAADAANGALPTATATNLSGNVSYAPVTLTRSGGFGTGTAVWEVTGNNSNSLENLDFGVYVSYSSSPQPSTMAVSMGFAPGQTSGAGLIPQFSDLSATTPFATFSACTPGTLVVTANNLSRVYGAPNPTLTASITGFVNGDTAAVVAGGPSLTTTATAASTPGSYPITVGAGTLVTANYNFAFVNGTLGITQASTATSLSQAGGVMTAKVSVVAPGAGTPTGSVQFLKGSVVLGTVPLTGSTAVFPATFGTLTAVYSGDANFLGSVSNPLTNQILNTSISVSSSANPSKLGEAVTLVASIDGQGTSGNSPTGSVQFLEAGKVLGTSALAGGQAAFTTSAFTGGTHIVSVQYSGDASYAAAQASYPQTVSAPVTIRVTVTPATPVFGQTVTLTATVTAPSTAGFAGPTGQVTFSEAGATPFTPNTVLGTATLNSGSGSFSLSTLAAGSHLIIAAYGGDATWPSYSRTMNVTVAPAPTTTTVALSLNAAGQVVLTAKVAPVTAGTGTPTGQVQFLDTKSGELLASASLSGGSASATESAAGVTHPIEAVYSGDVDFQGSTSAPLPVVVGAAGNPTNTFAPDEIAALFNIAALGGDVAGTPPLTTSLGGVTVKITDSAGNGRLAQIYGVFGSTGQINFVVPGDTAPGLALATVTLPGGGTVNAVLTIAKTAPGVFTANMDGQGVFAGQVVHTHADGSQSTGSPASTSAPYVPAPIDLGPATDQVVLVMYGTGMRHAASLTATVNGTTVPVAFYGAQGQYTGLDQINVSLPHSLAGAGLVKIVITADGQAANPVTAQIQ